MAAFTTIAAGVGLAATVASTGMSFANAGKQKKLAAEAKADADAAMEKARKALEVNFYEQQAINKEPYELQREALLSSGAQAIEAGVESGQAAPTAGRVQMAMNQGQAEIRTAMGKEMSDIDRAILSEESRLRDIGVQMDLGEAEGAQLARRDALEAQALANQQGWQGVISSAQQASQFIPLFAKTGEGEESVKSEGFKPAGMVNQLPAAKIPSIPIFNQARNVQPIAQLGPKPQAIYPNPYIGVGGDNSFFGY